MNEHNKTLTTSAVRVGQGMFYLAVVGAIATIFVMVVLPFVSH